MMATFMLMMIPRAAVCAERITEVLDTDSSVRTTGRAASTDVHGRAELELRDVRLRLPGCRRAGAARHLLHAPRPAGRPRSSAVPAPARPPCSLWCRGCSTRPAGRCSSTESTCATSSPTSCWRRIGLVPQKAYLFSGTVASNLRYGNPDATDDELWALPARSPRPRDFVARDARASSTRRSPRAARTSPAASASDWPSRGPSFAVRRSTCSTTRSRRWTWPPTPGCGRRCAR